MIILESAIIKITAGLVDHALCELELAGLFDEDSDYNGAIGDAVMELIEAFSGQGHSGFSAGWVLSVFDELAHWRNLTPITSNPDEWENVAEMSGYPLWQNKRNPVLFSEDGGETWYDVDEKDGNRIWTNAYVGGVGHNDYNLALENNERLTVYHRTDRESAEKIVESGKFISKDALSWIWFSSRPFGHHEPYGDTIVAADIVPQAVELNDEFPNGEVAVVVPPRYQRFLKNIRICGGKLTFRKEFDYGIH